MSNQVYANATRRYFTNNFSEATMITENIPVDFTEYLISAGMLEDTWAQLGGNITKNLISFSEGVSVAYSTIRDYIGSQFNSDSGNLTIKQDGIYLISTSVTLKRVVGMGDRIHFIGLSLNGNDPETYCSVYEISDNTLLTLTCSHIYNMVIDDQISINYSQNGGQDNIYAKYSLTCLQINY